jgi:hypothetical protein
MVLERFQNIVIWQQICEVRMARMQQCPYTHAVYVCHSPFSLISNLILLSHLLFGLPCVLYRSWHTMLLLWAWTHKATLAPWPFLINVRFQVLTAACMMFRVVFWLIPDDGGSTHLWNVGRQSFYTAVYPRRQLWTFLIYCAFQSDC